MDRNEKLFIETPLLHSKVLSDCISHPVYLKLENVQPCNSFKIRGISSLCNKAIESGCKGFVTFSGGNAGMTLAYIGHKLQIPAYIFVPSFVSLRIVEKFRFYGAQVKVTETSRDAYEQAIKFVDDNSDLKFVHPYDDPTLWDGYSEIIKEIKVQLNGAKPSLMVLSVGGGGLLMGILSGLEAVGWKDVPVLAMETFGAHSFHKSIIAGEVVENHMTSIAKTLGAPAIAPKLLDVLPKFNIFSEVMSDSEAVKACIRFADDHAYLVEVACGVSLAPIYSKAIIKVLSKCYDRFPNDPEIGPVVPIVCGGTDTSVSILHQYVTQLGLQLDI